MCFLNATVISMQSMSLGAIAAELSNLTAEVVWHMRGETFHEEVIRPASAGGDAVVDPENELRGGDW
jgi:hypothetical protein